MGPVGGSALQFGPFLGQVDGVIPVGGAMTLDSNTSWEQAAIELAAWRSGLADTLVKQYAAQEVERTRN